MILRRLIVLAIALAGLLVSGGVIIVGLIHAVYALLEPRIGAAGAAGVIIAVAAITLAVAAAVLFSLSKPKKVAVEVVATPVSNIVETLSQVVRDRPVVVVLAAVGAGVMAIRNPRYLASALRALVARREIEP